MTKKEAAVDCTSQGYADRIKVVMDKFAELVLLAGPILKNPTEETAEYCGRMMADLKELAEQAEEQIHKPLAACYRHYQQIIMVKRLHEMGEDVEKFSIKGIGTFRLQDDFHISIIPDKKEEAKLWLTENNMGDLITETVNASSLKASIKKYLKENGEFPDETLFKNYPVEFVKLTAR